MAHSANRSAGARQDRKAFCEYLRESREARNLSLEEIARITRIPQRSLECLERGQFESLPADVFVRGFLRSYAGCVGLDAEDAVRRYASCGLAPSPVASHTERARSSAEGTPAPELARGSVREQPWQGTPESEPGDAAADEAVAAQVAPDPVIEAPIDAPAEASPAASDDAVARANESADPPSTASDSQSTRSKSGKRRKRRGRKSRNRSRDTSRDDSRDVASAAGNREAERAARDVDDAEPRVEAGAEPQPSTDSEATPGAPEPRRQAARPSPMLVIDDADPAAAEVSQLRRQDKDRKDREATLRHFLPPVLLDPERGSRRGALTLAVIILVIVATLTMSYLLRHPSSSGSGVTELGEVSDLTRA